MRAVARATVELEESWSVTIQLRPEAHLSDSEIARAILRAGPSVLTIDRAP